MTLEWGFSALGYLQSFPVDPIKIDRSVIKTISAESKSCEIIRAIMVLARTFGISTTAEGIETEEQLDVVRESGCHHVQGILIASPLPLREFEHRYLTARARTKSEELRVRTGMQPT